MRGMMWFVHFFLFLSIPIAASLELEPDFKEMMYKKAKEQGIDPDNLQPGQSFMMPPEMTDEEEGSRHMPVDHKCDGCIAIAHQLEKSFKAAKRRVKRGAKLSFADVLEVTEDVCEKRLNDYGLKNINGKKKLSGQGLKMDKKQGIMEAGGKWQARLKSQCLEMIEEHEEEGIYQMYEEKGDQRLKAVLCKDICPEEELEDEEVGKDEL